MFLSKNLKTKGFSLMEMVITIGIIGILAGTLTPAIMDQLLSAKYTKAKNDVQAIVNAVSNFRQTTKQFPTLNNAKAEAIEVLWSGTTQAIVDDDDAADGDPSLPAGGEWAGKAAAVYDNIANHLFINENDRYETDRWAGPYLTESPYDSWEKSYVISVQGFHAGKTGTGKIVWVLSGGSDGNLDTAINSQAFEVTRNDVGMRMQ